MKKYKNKFRAILLEGLAEIGLTLICFGVGSLIFTLFGAELDSSNIDSDLIVLLGIAVIIVIFGVSFAFVQWFKKRISNKSQ